jgi:peptide-methionine (S)-S-oxide reductase
VNDSSNPSPSNSLETATLGGGCFWCLDPVYADLQGVTGVTAGYAGGTVSNPSYSEVCTGATRHAEVVQVRFDPQVISFKEILQVFFSVHDPTTLNRQGADVGTQYRSVIFYHSPHQKQVAEELIAELNQAGIWKNPIVTEVSPAGSFYAAEDYHQSYFKKNPYQGYCQVVIAPKLTKFRKSYPSRLKNSL